MLLESGSMTQLMFKERHEGAERRGSVESVTVPLVWKFTEPIRSKHHGRGHLFCRDGF